MFSNFDKIVKLRKIDLSSPLKLNKKCEDKKERAKWRGEIIVRNIRINCNIRFLYQKSNYRQTIHLNENSPKH